MCKSSSLFLTVLTFTILDFSFPQGMGLKDPYRNIGILISWWICGRHCLGYMFHSKISQLMFLSPDCTGLVLPPPRKHQSQNFYVVVSICIFPLKSEVYRCFLTSTEWVSSILEAYFPFFLYPHWFICSFIHSLIYIYHGPELSLCHSSLVPKWYSIHIHTE